MKRSKRGVLAVVGVVAIAGSMLATSMTAGAGGSSEYIKAWPTLSVDKALTPDDRVAATGPFTVVVTCDYPEKEVEPGGHDEPFVTTLVFNADGTPQSASQGGWVNDGNAWSFTGSELKNKECTVEETGKANATSVEYGCAFSNVPFEQPANDNDVEAEDSYDIDPGCVGTSPSATPAVVQFGSPWDGSCLNGTYEVAPEGKKPQCEQSALVTVVNTLPKAEPAAQQVVQPRFTG